jgi:branched-subunit amino acid transport protein
MSDAWITIVALAVGTILIRAAGPLLLGGRDLPDRLRGVIALLAPALLAGLVAVQTFAAPSGGEYELDARALGVGAAGLALVAGATTLPVVALAAVVTALVRLAF